ncbi:hypothetical protein BYT27DRAFT_7093216 [Phlegmacium glaucopus]|nr:hypothetical protein BYT27DRAFT_7093216 [Phlegmacium glaucopus]
MRKFPRLGLTVRWTPGHVGLAGNEEVDGEAKKAMEGEERNVNSNFSILKGILPTSKSAHKQWLKEKGKRQWKKEFQKGPRYQRACTVDPSMPSSKY